MRKSKHQIPSTRYQTNSNEDDVVTIRLTGENRGRNDDHQPASTFYEFVMILDLEFQGAASVSR